MLDRYARKKKKTLVILERSRKPQLHDSATHAYIGLVYRSYRGTESSCNTLKLVDAASDPEVQDFCRHQNQRVRIGDFAEHGEGSEESRFLLLISFAG